MVATQPSPLCRSGEGWDLACPDYVGNWCTHCAQMARIRYITTTAQVSPRTFVDLLALHEWMEASNANDHHFVLRLVAFLR